jgi:hypothetical protein
MVDTIAKTIILYDNQGRIIKDLKPGMTAHVRVHSTPIYRIQDKEFSNINKNNYIIILIHFWV